MEKHEAHALHEGNDCEERWECKRGLNILNDELVTTPHTAGDPETAVDNLGVALVGCLDGGEHAEAVASGVDLLGCVEGGEEGVEDVAGAGEGAAGAHFEAGILLVSGYSNQERRGGGG